MALERPKFNVPSAAESKQFVDSNNRFLTLKDGDTVQLRFLPAAGDNPSIFFPVANHHGLKTQDNKKVALACLGVHGTVETGKRCLLCEASRYLKETDEELAKETRAQTRFYTQVLQAMFGTVGGKPVLKGWSGPKLIQWSGKAQGKLQAIADSMEKMGEPLFYDPDQGQALMVTRIGAKMDTEYMPERTGKIVGLDEIRPTWGDEFLTDINEAAGLNVASRELQLSYLRVSYPAIDWATALVAGEADED